jgi:hypothetical protein
MSIDVLISLRFGFLPVFIRLSAFVIPSLAHSSQKRRSSSSKYLKVAANNGVSHEIHLFLLLSSFPLS